MYRWGGGGGVGGGCWGGGDVEGFWLCHERIYLIPSKVL